MNSIIEKRKQNWLDFYDLKGSVNRLLVVDYTQGAMKSASINTGTLEGRVEWAYQRYMLQMENMEKLNDNTIPHLAISSGTGTFAEPFGCKIHKTASNTSFTMPLIKDVSEWYKIKAPRLEDTKLINLFEIADRLQARVGKEALFGLPDIQSPMDVAALIWDKNDFYAAMFDEENAIKELACMVKELMFAFLDEWFRRYGKEFIAHYPRYYMPYGITMSEDEIGIVSSDMFNEFFRDELYEFSQRYGAIGIHCCADSNHQWENLKKIPNLKLLNFVRDEVNTKKAVEFFKGTVAQFHNTIVDIKDLPDYQNIHLGNLLYADSLESAVEMANKYNSVDI